MSSVVIFPKPLLGNQAPLNPLPKLLQTPHGLAFLEIQGTINFPPRDAEGSSTDVGSDGETPIGRLVFPDYHPDAEGSASTAWTKLVYLYVGKHQRLAGEVKKLPKAIAVIRKRIVEDLDRTGTDPAETAGPAEELEVVEIVKWKIVFSRRPEPVGAQDGES